MTILNASNNATTLLDGAITNVATSLEVISSSLFPSVPFMITIDDEIMRVTNVSGTTLTVTRAQESTTGAAHINNSMVENRWTAGTYDGLVAEIASNVSTSGTPEALDYAKFVSATEIEGRTYAEARTDLGLVIGTNVLAEQTIGIADNNLVEIDGATVADNDFAKFTANGLEGRSYAETLSDIDALSNTKRAVMGGGAIINGNFDIWQRGITQATNDYASDDRWENQHVGSSKVATQQAFTVGQTDVPNNPTYYSRTVGTTAEAAGNYVRKVQKIENVNSFSGESVTLSFWAKADASKNMAIEFVQDFGSGGSADVTSIGSQKIALTTSWVKQEVTISITSISGKTVGTDSSLNLILWFEAGSDFNARTDTLGQQSGTFEIAQVKLEKGTVATEFIPKTYAEEKIDCFRYFERKYSTDVSASVASGVYITSTQAQLMINYTEKRIDPTINYSSQDGFQTRSPSGSLDTATVVSNHMSLSFANIVATTTSATAGYGVLLRINASEYIDIDSEL